MHEVGCARNNYKCPKCGEVVPKADKEEHENTMHVEVTCKYCGKKDQKFNFGDHESKCEQRPQECKFCEQMVDFAKYNDHIYLCGSRTRKCMKCTHMILLRDWDSHEIGGECKAFIEEDKRKRIEEEKRKKEAEERLERE